MKRLMLLRHAKAMPAASGVADRDRPLAPRGHRDAALIGKAMADETAPDLILCSPTRRTQETLAEVQRYLSPEPTVVVADELYGGTSPTYAEAIAALGDDADRLLVIGHNPAIHATALALATKVDGKLKAKFPTSAVVVIEFDAKTWAGIGAGKGRLVSFLRPKDLGAKDADD